MNRTIALSLVLATAAIGNAFAGDGEFAHDQQAAFSSTASRAEVQSELAQYRRDGIDTSSYEYNPLSQFKSGLKRAEVTSDYIANRAQVAAMNAEASGAEAVARNVDLQRHATTMAGDPVNAQ
jgi:hypothetical protein